MKIAIDLNDVVRDYSNNFVKYYVERFNHEFDLSDFELFSHDMKVVLPFPTDHSYNKFVYEDYVYELFTKCPYCSTNIDVELRRWQNDTIRDIDTAEPIELMFVSSMEYGASIGCTYMFLSKLGTNVRECYFPMNSSTIWDKCDVLITANPNLLDSKPDGKISIKIKTDYNTKSNSDYSYTNLKSFISDENNILKCLMDE